MNTKLFNQDTYAATRKQEQAILKDRIKTALMDLGELAVYRAYVAVPYEGTDDVGIFATEDEALKALRQELRRRRYVSDYNSYFVEAIVVGCPELRQDWIEIVPGKTAKGNLSLKTVSLV